MSAVTLWCHSLRKAVERVDVNESSTRHHRHMKNHSTYSAVKCKPFFQVWHRPAIAYRLIYTHIHPRLINTPLSHSLSVWLSEALSAEVTERLLWCHVMQGRPGPRGPRGFPGLVGIGVKGEPGIPGQPGKPAFMRAGDGRIDPNLVRSFNSLRRPT